ncbi:uncharacterized protein LOC133929095 [Phragmites australis]|uniref:uncharacterized protein LOC133929095 n=1 Tax=Phragmites australis TaxID=29695 RepID=UPI002D793770|nr:uncharacterized protein LOC133929095 [Phragmites australis]
MGRKRSGGEGPSTAGRVTNQAVSLREESSGRTRVDEASLMRVKHLQRLAAWAGAEAGVGPIGALLGRRLAANAEAAGVPLGAATFLCQRCETVLKPGFNCTIRIKKKRNKTKRRKKSNRCQNNVAYACHFCGDQNLILGSGKGVVKSLLSSRELASMDSARRISGGNNSKTRTQDMKEVLEHSQAAILQIDSSSRSRQSISESDEQGERLKRNIPRDCKTEEGVTLSAVRSGHLAASTFEEDSIQKLALENTNDEHIHETEPICSKKVKICEANVSPPSEFMVGSKFVTPQKNKLMDSAEPFKTRSTGNKKGEISGSVTGNNLTSSSKSAPIDSWKNIKSATSDSAQVSGSSRKRTRKGWTTLKQIAEKDELERKEKMGSFVIPFFMS